MNSRYGGARPTQTRHVLPVINVACDDTRTAVAYFTVLKRELQGKKVVNVIAAPKHGATADDVVDVSPPPSPYDAQDLTFALIDADTCRDIDRIRTKGEGKKVQVLFSNPCFEIWILAHLQNTGEAFVNCAAVLARVKQKWKEVFGSEFGTKAQAHYGKLADARTDAISNCKSRNPAVDQSWTEVWRAVEAMLL